MSFTATTPTVKHHNSQLSDSNATTLNVTMFSHPLETTQSISLPNAIVWRFVRPAVVVGKFEIRTRTTLKK
jgi:hypothetical protein